MVRTQLQLDEDTYNALRRRAFAERRSMSSVARDILRETLSKGYKAGPKTLEQFSFISSGASGRSDISVRHDEALAEDLA